LLLETTPYHEVTKGTKITNKVWYQRFFVRFVFFVSS